MFVKLWVLIFSCPIIYNILFIFIFLSLMWIAIIIILWLIFGSLGSVILTRFTDGITRSTFRWFLFWYSQCPECRHRLMAKNLVPIISYFVHGGKCRYCGKKISWMYPVLEVLWACVFLITYLFLYKYWISILVLWLITNRLLMLLLVYDLRTYELHMIVWILLAIVWIVANIFLEVGDLRSTFLSALLFGGVFTWIYFFGKWYAKMRFKKEMEWFGEGDVYLAVIIWILLPIALSIQWIVFSWWMMINVLILFVLISSILGLIWSGIQYIIGIWGMGHVTRQWIFSSSLVPSSSSLNVIPFFPAMIVAFWILAWKAPYFISLLFG